jgi:hypothetical protein
MIMESLRRKTGCKVIPIDSKRRDARGAERSPRGGHSEQSLDLAGLAEFIRTDRYLHYLVAEAACVEFRFAWLSIEDAIVLLGRDGLRSLLANSFRYGRRASEFCRLLEAGSGMPAQAK